MGLDMYLNGYWRKHPDLHGYIVNEFAGGVDECQRVSLTCDDLERVLNATLENTLPTTTGFFFGQSCSEDRDETIKILQEAIAWLSEDGFGRTMYYQASW
jgi:hypothetical protein